MAQFDVYALRTGLVVDVQTNLIWGLGTRLVVPLMPSQAVPPALPRLHPEVQFGDRTLVVATHLLAAVPEKTLGNPLGSLATEYDRLRLALDMIFNGF